MAQVLSNLLTNAAKYTDPGGRISVAVGIELDELTITVRDTGIGIRRDAIASLFSMFSQIQSTLDRTEGGLGIGLALASELVKLHGGRIDARSDGDGCGSEFTVRLPSSMVQHDSTTVSTIQPAIERMDASRLVLIADDNVDAATSLGMLLEIAGNDVLIVNDGVDALEVARQRRPHVAILDIGMPGMNGYEVAETLRKESWGKGVLLIALTGWGQRDDKARALTAGFDHHFTKPVESDELQALISAHAPTSKVDKSSGHEAAPLRRSRRRLGDNQFPVTAMHSADLLEANEQLILAALHAETMATTAEHNLSELTRSSQRDVLTGTPNRALMLDRLESAIAMAQRHAAHVAVLFIDLDNFKQINDTWGHAVGDDVLQRVARHLESVVRASDTVSRHGGDEFLVLLTEVSQRTDAAAIAAKMLVALAEPALPGAQLPSLSASIGISLYPEDGADAASLISCADAAMYRAKQNGNNCFEFYAAHFDFARTQRGRSP